MSFQWDRNKTKVYNATVFKIDQFKTPSNHQVVYKIQSNLQLNFELVLKNICKIQISIYTEVKKIQEFSRKIMNINILKKIGLRKQFH